MNLNLSIPRSTPVADGATNFPTYTIRVNDVSLLFLFFPPGYILRLGLDQSHLGLLSPRKSLWSGNGFLRQCC